MLSASESFEWDFQGRKKIHARCPLPSCSSSFGRAQPFAPRLLLVIVDGGGPAAKMAALVPSRVVGGLVHVVPAELDDGIRRWILTGVVGPDDRDCE